jgi:hypothetical protein
MLVMVMMMLVFAMMAMSVLMFMFMPMLVVMMITHVHIKFYALDTSLLRVSCAQVIIFNGKLFQLAFQRAQLDAQIEKRADEHVAADPAEAVEVKCFHSNSPAANALIWLAA